jgi:hypothetical protein
MSLARMACLFLAFGDGSRHDKRLAKQPGPHHHDGSRWDRKIRSVSTGTQIGSPESGTADLAFARLPGFVEPSLLSG